MFPITLKPRFSVETAFAADGRTRAFYVLDRGSRVSAALVSHGAAQTVANYRNVNG